MKEQESASKKKVLKQFLSGDNLFGKERALAPILKEFLEETLYAEMEEHLRDEENGWSSGNKRNGMGNKTVKSNLGEVTIKTPQDRKGSFEPKIVKKRQCILTDRLEDQIISLYGMRSSMRDISAHIREMYDTEVSNEVISRITDRVVPKVKKRQNRPLENVYCIIWLDAMHFKVQEDGKLRHKVQYNMLGINKKGKKELLGMYLSESEGANFWLQVLSDFHHRGVRDILIVCTDNLTGFPEAIQSVFPKAEVQLSIVH
uniref:IS256 family transposase n=1 Tax=Algoriphagus resistens TaxID=1750590 RepID=UPI000716C02C|nr:IS256 family transposase [Algoriphagus resistens]